MSVVSVPSCSSLQTAILTGAPGADEDEPGAAGLKNSVDATWHVEGEQMADTPYEILDRSR